MSECEQFPEGSRNRAICEGMANLPLWKINRYRERWGLPPLEAKPPGADPAMPRSPPATKPKPQSGGVTVRPPNPTRPHSDSRVRSRLGDKVIEALGKLGIAEESVATLLGKTVGCRTTAKKARELRVWAEKFLENKFATQGDALDVLENLLE